MKANPVDIFNYVVETLPNGETLAIKCDNEKQIDRLRMALYRQRAKLEKISPAIAAVITVSKRTENKDYAVIIGKNIENFEISITDINGKETPFKGDIQSADGKAARDRVRRLMIADGKSEEEIEEYFQNI
jgi:hypothetical protein